MVENLSKDDSQYLSQQFDNDVLDLVTQKVFYLYEYMSDFEKFKEELPHKDKFYSSLTGSKIAKKEYDHALNVWTKFEMKTMKNYHHDLYLECDVLLLPDGFEKFRNNKLKELWIMSKSLFERTKFKLGCNA